MKRVLSIVLALSLIAGLMTGLTLTASAETIINDIAITGVTAPVVGQEPTTTGISTSVAYTQDIAWSVWDNGGYRPFNDGETFANGKVYLLDISLWINDGYSFADWQDLTASVNGNSIPDFDSDRDWARFELIYIMDGVTVLDHVVISSVPAVEAGTSTDLSGVTVPSGANYTVSVNWYKETYYSQEDYWGWEWYQGATLEDGCNYYLDLQVSPKEGYWISKNTEIKVEGSIQPSWTNSQNGYAQAHVDYDLRPVVSSVDLTTSGEPAHGVALSSVTVTAPAGANYTVTPTWKTWNGNTGNYDAATGNFGYGEYWLEVEIIPNSGYTILSDATPTINGQSYYDYSDFGHWREDDIDGNRENGFLLICSDIYINPENGYVWEVDLSGAPESITAGGAMPTPTITVVDGDVTVTGTKWLNDEMAPVTGNFENGKSYYLAIDLATKPSYAFEGWVEAYMNDEYCDGCNIDDTRTTATVYVYYTLKPVIEKVELTVTVPAVGAAPGVVTLPGGVKFVLDSDEEVDFPGYAWYIDGGQEFEKFENGKKYFVDVYLLPAEGYEFANDVVVTVNGEEVEEGYMFCNGYNLNIWHAWSFKEVIKSVNITTPDYKVGDVFKPEDVTVPANTGCEVGYVGMYSGYTDPYTAIGKDRYRLNVELNAKDGYEFAEDCVITVNGKALDEVYSGETYQDVYYEFSLCEKITKIEFPALPTVNAGDTVQYQDLEAPAGAKYYLFSDWYDADMNWFNGTTQNGKAYFLELFAHPMEGYEFSEDCVITVNGQEASFPIMRVDYNMAAFAKQYNFGMPTIDKVELTITAPADGEKPTTTVTVPDGAKYSVDNIGWYESKTGEKKRGALEYMDRRDTFSYGYYYLVAAGIQAKEGYVFAEDAVLVINGETMEVELGEFGTYLTGNYGQFFYCFDKLEDTYDDNPKTGITGISVLAAMMALSATAAGVIISKKKEF